MSTKDGHIEQKVARLETLQDSVRPDRELSWRAVDSCDEAFRVARRAALVGAIPTLLAVAALLVAYTTPVGSAFQGVVLAQVLVVNVAVVVGGTYLYALAVGFAAGRLAHRFAFHSNLSVSTLAMLMAWVANLSLWGWVLVIVVRLMTRS